MRILHLSDLHFGTSEKGDKEHSVHFFHDSRTGKPHPTALLDVLQRDALLKDTPPQVTVISGDVGWSGRKDDYKYALQFVRGLKNRWPKTLVVLAPGNHDVDLRDGIADQARQDAYRHFTEAFYGRKWKQHYKDPFRSTALEARDALTSVFRTDGPDGRRALIISANSAACLVRDAKITDQVRDAGPVCITHDVLKQLEAYLATKEASETSLRIFVLHHHLLPFAEGHWENNADPREMTERPDRTMLANSARLQGFLARHQFALVLHGHKHVAHGRQDTLWRKEGRTGQVLAIVGAGSAGVYAGERPHQEPLNYNVIDVSCRDTDTWDVSVETRLIEDAAGLGRPSQWFTYEAFAGRATSDGLSVFRARTMTECHRHIASAAHGGQQRMHNFVAVVELAAYLHAPTLRIGDAAASEDDVRRSFLALHPEYDPVKGWGDEKLVRRALSGRPGQYSIEHGSRLFAMARAAVEDGRQPIPILASLEELEHGVGRAYTGLYRAEQDVELGEASPGLVGIQFIERKLSETSSVLDIVATFRSLELSFWWGVNMMECSELLRWALTTKYLQRSKPRPGRITLFAAVAEWRKEPNAIFQARVDVMPLREIVRLIQRFAEGTQAASDDLRGLLEEKARATHVRNIDRRGLARLIPVLQAVTETVSRGKPRLIRLAARLQASHDEMVKAISRPDDRHAHVTAALAALQEASDLLRTTRRS